MAETKKILDPKIKLTATCVRVPVFVGHSEAVNIEFEKPLSAEEAREILREAPGVHGRRQAREWRLRDAGRMRRRFRHLRVAASARTPPSRTALNLWIVSDNLRKGAALNTVQIAESLINRGLLKKAA